MELTPGTSRSGITYSSPSSVRSVARQVLTGLANQSPQIVTGVRNSDLVDVVIDLSHQLVGQFGQTPSIQSQLVPLNQLGDRVNAYANPRLRQLARSVFARSRGSRYSRGSRRKMWLKHP